MKLVIGLQSTSRRELTIFNRVQRSILLLDYQLVCNIKPRYICNISNIQPRYMLTYYYYK